MHHNLLMLVGSYAEDQRDGLRLYSFDFETASVRFLDSIDLEAPSYMTFSPHPSPLTHLPSSISHQPSPLTHLPSAISHQPSPIYVVDELKNEEARLVAISIEGHGNKLKVLNSFKTGGASPCYVSMHNDIVATANYRGGSLSVFHIGKTGEIHSLLSVIKGTTGGPDMTRQDTPHIHCVLFSPDGKYLFATDFSADQIIMLETSKIITDTSRKTWPLAYPGGYGPRHLVFSPDGRFLYVIGELSDCVTVFAYDEGRLTEVQTIEADPDHGRGGADIRFSPDGHFLYTSHRRKNDKIVIFSVNRQSGRLTRIGQQSTKSHPRQFCLTPNGKYLLAACMDDDVIQVFQRNPSTGLLSNTNREIKVKRPAFVGFRKQ